MYLLLLQDNIIQSVCIEILGIKINNRLIIYKTLCMQYIFPIIFVVDPDGACR